MFAASKTNLLLIEPSLVLPANANIFVAALNVAQHATHKTNSTFNIGRILIL